jgi:polyisoprenoid-binding protein YceI
MKATKVLLLTAWLLALQLTTLHAQSFAVKTYKLTVKGTSSLHDWESSVEKLEARGSFVLGNSTLTDVRDVTVTIPVKAIKSTKGKLMDNKTWEAFNYEKHPEIIFVLTGKKIDPLKNTLHVSGTLKMAGVTRTIDLALAYKALPGGDLQFTGSKKLLMSDYKMDPPTAMMGTIKVGDEVEIAIDIILNNNNTL